MRNSLYANEVWQQCQLVKCYGVAGRGQGGEMIGGDPKGGAEKERKSARGIEIVCDLRGGELPHAGKQDGVVASQRFGKERSTQWVKEYGGGDPHQYGGRLPARRGDYLSEIEGFCAA